MTSATEAESEPPPSARGLKRTLGSILGLLLLIAAVVFALRRGADPAQLLRALRSAPWWLVGLALILPVVNWIIVSLSFWVPMRRLGRVTPAEMLALIGAAWLLNYLPLRPGLFGRIAYHKAANAIAVRDSVAVTVLGMACGGFSVFSTLAIAAVLPPSATPLHWLTALAIPLIAALISAAVLRPSGRSWIAVMFLLRYSDLLVWIVRYAVVFRLAEVPIGLSQAVAFAAVSQLSVLIPISGNGLGVREWGIGLVAAHWPLPLATPALAMPVAITADLLNRAIEIAIAIPAGLGGALWLARKKKR